MSEIDVWDSGDHSFEADEMTPEDLAIIQAFKEMQDLAAPGSLAATAYQEQEPEQREPITDQIAIGALARFESSDEMLVLFTKEASEDISILRQAIAALEQDDTLDATSFTTLRRAAHKLKGTAGAIGCNSMSTIAYYIEMLVGLVQDGTLVPMIGLMALVQAIRALEATLQSIVATAQESSNPLTELEAEYEALNDFGSAYRPQSHTVLGLTGSQEVESLETTVKLTSPLKEEVTRFQQAIGPQHEVFAPLPSVHVDTHRLEQLMLHTEHLTEQRGQLEGTHKQIESALQELYAAQSRLRHLEVLFSFNTLPQSDIDWQSRNAAIQGERSNSSLIARILDEAVARSGHSSQHKNKPHPIAAKVRASSGWDELEIDQYTEHNVLIHAFSEAIADVTTATAQLRTAFGQFNQALYKHIEQANHVRGDALLLRSAALSTLLPRIKRAIKMSADAQQRSVSFEVKGETTEIDQDILESLARPLLQLVRYCVTDSLGTLNAAGEERNTRHRCWLHAYAAGNEVFIELGFSMAVRSGALDLVRGPMQQLSASIMMRKNQSGGLSFFLNLPRSQGAIQGLRVRVGQQHVVVPFSQMRRIEYERPETEHAALHSLTTLLGFSENPDAKAAIRPVLLLQSEGPTRSQAVYVDDVLGSVELLVKPLDAHLRRPGISGAAIDSKGDILLVVDVVGLIEHWETLQQHGASVQILPEGKKCPCAAGQSILIADDSVYIRQSLCASLSRAGYRVSQARDGMDAWEQLLEQPPDVLLLDIEMPNLNGYDLLSMIRASTQFSNLKVIMLTARSSEKHQHLASELGAQAYLTKPASQNELFSALRMVLTPSAKTEAR